MRATKGWTTIEQSKRLVEAGLDPNTADMNYRYCICKCIDGEPKEDWLLGTVGVFEECPDEQIPCWSLGRLIDLMQRKIQFKGYDCYFHLEDYDESEFEIEYHCSAKGITLKWWHGESLVDICVDALCWQFTTNIHDNPELLKGGKK